VLDRGVNILMGDTPAGDGRGASSRPPRAPGSSSQPTPPPPPPQSHMRNSQSVPNLAPLDSHDPFMAPLQPEASFTPPAKSSRAPPEPNPRSADKLTVLRRVLTLLRRVFTLLRRVLTLLRPGAGLGGGGTGGVAGGGDGGAGFLTRSLSAFGFSKPKKNQAKLGDDNSFYFNEELKMWVERGKEDEAKAVAAPPPPPPTQMPTMGKGPKKPAEIPSEFVAPYLNPID
jgi:hypothetical protein